ncbi:DUF4259 domain-containing protein [Streptomyces sp. NPDC098789]|uniref:DUF4259 domain-containing protein n=1 Tax=Streptomyces sp. NPDC098789 TaxID=3366098 RepID=UPI00380437FA
MRPRSPERRTPPARRAPGAAARRRGGRSGCRAHWPRRIPPLSGDLRELAVQALDRVVTDPCELMELWGGTDASGAWRGTIVQLRTSLLDPHAGPGRLRVPDLRAVVQRADAADAGS